MTSRSESRLRQLDLRRTTGLVALTIGLMAEGVRLIAVDQEWIVGAGTVDRTLTVVWMVGMGVFGLAFASLWWLGQRLEADERRVLGDEYQSFLSRRRAIFAFVVTYVTGSLIAAIPATESLPGRAVALVLMAVATGALAVGGLNGVRA